MVQVEVWGHSGFCQARRMEWEGRGAYLAQVESRQQNKPVANPTKLRKEEGCDADLSSRHFRILVKKVDLKFPQGHFRHIR